MVALSVVVPVRDGAGVLAGCLDALAAQDLGDVEVVVVDDGSRDDSAVLARSHPLRPRVLSTAPAGSYAARNAGIAATSGDLVAFTDSDCRPRPGWLTAGVAALTGADLVGGAVVAATSRRPTVWERYDRALYLDQAELVAHAGMAATANLFVAREVFTAVGPFAADMPSSGDLEFCRRAVAAGFRLAYAADAVVEHRPRTGPAETWRLHRRLGAGWAALARRGAGVPVWREPGLRVALGTVVERVAREDPPLRRRHLAPAHALAMTARLVGRVTGR